VRLTALNLEGISGESGWSLDRIGDSENLRFHLNSLVSHFHLMSPFCVNQTEYDTNRVTVS